MQPVIESNLSKGKWAEQQACEFLLAQGLLLIQKNFACKYGEIDLIMQHGQVLVMVEVRFRSSEIYGGAIESVTLKKQAKIIRTSQYYQIMHAVQQMLRFDVIAIAADRKINWIQNAFQT